MYENWDNLSFWLMLSFSRKGWNSAFGRQITEGQITLTHSGIEHIWSWTSFYKHWSISSLPLLLECRPSGPHWIHWYLPGSPSVCLELKFLFLSSTRRRKFSASQSLSCHFGIFQYLEGKSGTEFWTNCSVSPFFLGSLLPEYLANGFKPIFKNILCSISDSSWQEDWSTKE